MYISYITVTISLISANYKTEYVLILSSNLPVHLCVDQFQRYPGKQEHLKLPW